MEVGVNAAIVMSAGELGCAESGRSLSLLRLHGAPDAFVRRALKTSQMRQQ
jgi:hypothetical protein